MRVNLPTLNETYGYLTVREIYTKKDSRDDRQYCTVECICGNVREIRAYMISSLKVKSCGCMSDKKSLSKIISDKFQTHQYSKPVSLREKELISMCSDSWVFPGMPESLFHKKTTYMIDRTRELLTLK